MKKILIICLCLVTIFVACSDEAEPEKEPTIQEIGENYTQALLDGEYEKTYNDFEHASMLFDLVNPEVYEETMTEIKTSLGEIIKVHPSFQTEVDQQTIVSIPVEGDSVNFNVFFNNQGEISAFVPSTFKLDSSLSMPEGVSEEDITLSSHGFELDGTLTTPTTESDFPLVIIVGGSGPTDKDGTIYANKVYQDMAWQLASQGVATYRYDKRHHEYGMELSSDTTMTIFDEYVDDVVSAVELAKSFDNINGDNIYVLGHSLGGNIIPLVDELVSAKGYMLMGANASPYNELLLEQMAYLESLSEELSPEDEELYDYYYTEIEKIENLDSYNDDEFMFGVPKAYWEHYTNYSAIESAKKITEPVLVLQGERDYQATMSEYNLWYEAFSESDNWSFKTYETLNHFMISGEGIPNPEEYYIPGTVDSEVIDDITEFVSESDE